MTCFHVFLVTNVVAQKKASSWHWVPDNNESAGKVAGLCGKAPIDR
jgi:hypothetical protein